MIWLRWQFRFWSACDCRYNYCRAVHITSVILNYQDRAITALLTSEHRTQICVVNIPTPDFSFPHNIMFLSD